MHDLNFNLSSVIKRGTKVGKKVELRQLMEHPRQSHVHYHENTMRVGIKGALHGSQGMANRSLTRVCHCVLKVFTW